MVRRPCPLCDSRWEDLEDHLLAAHGVHPSRIVYCVACDGGSTWTDTTIDAHNREDHSTDLFFVTEIDARGNAAVRGAYSDFNLLVDYLEDRGIVFDSRECRGGVTKVYKAKGTDTEIQVEVFEANRWDDEAVFE